MIAAKFLKKGAWNYTKSLSPRTPGNIEVRTSETKKWSFLQK